MDVEKIRRRSLQIAEHVGALKARVMLLREHAPSRMDGDFDRIMDLLSQVSGDALAIGLETNKR
jgi:hypothetical protein